MVIKRYFVELLITILLKEVIKMQKLSKRITIMISTMLLIVMLFGTGSIWASDGIQFSIPTPDPNDTTVAEIMIHARPYDNETGQKGGFGHSFISIKNI